MKLYKYIFTDGYNLICGKMDRMEIKVNEKYHGKLIKTINY